MKKLFTLALALALALALLAACGGKGGDADKKPAQWPDDEFTRQIPKPDFNLFLANTSGNKFTAVFKGVTLEQIKAYTESVKAAGFTLAPELDEAATYKYKASNGNGYSIDLTRYTSDDQTVYLWITKE